MSLPHRPTPPATLLSTRFFDSAPKDGMGAYGQAVETASRHAEATR
ncbi:hypothetical protein [Thiobacillus sp.]